MSIYALTKTAEQIEALLNEIEAGERVTAWIGSANRDANVFDDPDEFYTLQLTIDEALV